MSQKTVNVAVAILHYQAQYLLGFRNASQHQGEKYEFIGGKIEQNETPCEGLVREIFEEIGCDISKNIAINMGVIRHHYPEKTVMLHCFKIEINQSQFEQLQTEKGTEGQAITWVKKADLLAKKYPLPDANIRILDWLTLPNTIFISQSLDKFANENDWLDYYVKRLPQNAHFYIRPQTDNDKSIKLIVELQTQRHDIKPLIQYQTFLDSDLTVSNEIIHLNHQQLMRLYFDNLPKNQRYFASCHDKNSLSKLNDFAKSHTVMGCFLSPVLCTPTHPESEGMGWDKFSKLAQMCDMPVYALGGLGRTDLENVWQNNGFGVAGIRMIDEF